MSTGVLVRCPQCGTVTPYDTLEKHGNCCPTCSVMFSEYSWTIFKAFEEL